MLARTWACGCLVAAAIVLPASPLDPDAGAIGLQVQTTVFKSAVDQVRLDVLVSSGGAPVGDLEAGDFEILDNGVPQVPALVTNADGASLLFVLDTSDSLQGARFAELVQAVRAFTEQALPADRIGLLTFADSARLLVPLQAGQQGVAGVREALDAIPRTEGRTAMHDGVIAGLEALEGSAGGSLLVLLTDGEDNASAATREDVLEAVRRSQAMIGVVAVGVTNDPSLPLGAMVDQRERLLRLVAEANGGPFLRVDFGPKRLGQAFGRILEEFRGRYVLSYTPRNVARDDGWHTLGVRVRQGRARSRAGYSWRTNPGACRATTGGTR